jgi:hypothetical protein
MPDPGQAVLQTWAALAKAIEFNPLLRREYEAPLPVASSPA